MAETVSSGAPKRYLIKAFATTETAEDWLAHCVADGYHFLSMNNMQSTNHFSKELEGLMWVIVELDNMGAPD
jgi:hypothetical protein